MLRRDAVIDMLGLDINRDDQNQVHDGGDEQKDGEDIGTRNGRKTGFHALFDEVMVDTTTCNWTKVNVVAVFEQTDGGFWKWLMRRARLV